MSIFQMKGLRKFTPIWLLLIDNSDSISYNSNHVTKLSLYRAKAKRQSVNFGRERSIYESSAASHPGGGSGYLWIRVCQETGGSGENSSGVPPVWL